MSNSSSNPRNQREHRLDFWRGLCLIDMVLVHLVYQNVQFGKSLGMFLGEYSRFAAGGFIFISGLSIGVIFLPRALKPDKRWSTYRSLFRRSVYILAIQYVCAIGLILLWLWRGTRAPSAHPWHVLENVFLLRDGGDLLPFYVLMIAFSPLFLELARAPYGKLVMLIGSLSLFTWGLWHPWALSIAQHENFPPVLWQALFVIGLLFGCYWHLYNRISRTTKAFIAVGLWAIFGVLFWAEWWYEFGWPWLNLHVSFSKVPLSLGEGIRYLDAILAIAFTSDVFWNYLGPTRVASFVEQLGRKSLPVYVLHLWIMELAGWAAWRFWWMGRWQISFAVASIALLWMYARSVESYNRFRTRLRENVAILWGLPGRSMVDGAR